MFIVEAIFSFLRHIRCDPSHSLRDTLFVDGGQSDRDRCKTPIQNSKNY